jgi:3-phenylpropionate/cinnamic acid dioxygenase small subunit
LKFANLGDIVRRIPHISRERRSEMKSSPIFLRTIGIALLLVAVSLSLPAGAMAQAAAPKARSIEERIQHLEDTQEIRDLLTSYGRLLDAHDLAGYSHLFAKNGEWVGGFGSAKGPAAIQALMEKNLGATAKGKPGSTYHLLTNFMIDVNGDTATAWSRWSFTVTSADKKPSILYGGHYDDKLIREDGRWKFLRRVAVNDIPHSDPTDTK